ncbi:hypothetical protein BKA63DRAFT_484914 [Paraphoma chrysanthemicola]|nr:hypothetical protein BKA63DRAFT_484914 [Paraphoma chrysanthemicola]
MDAGFDPRRIAKPSPNSMFHRSSDYGTRMPPVPLRNERSRGQQEKSKLSRNDGHDDIKEQGPMLRGSDRTRRFTPPLLDPNNFPYASSTIQPAPSGYQEDSRHAIHKEQFALSFAQVQSLATSEAYDTKSEIGRMFSGLGSSSESFTPSQGSAMQQNRGCPPLNGFRDSKNSIRAYNQWGSTNSPTSIALGDSLIESSRPDFKPHGPASGSLSLSPEPFQQRNAQQQGEQLKEGNRQSSRRPPNPEHRTTQADWMLMRTYGGKKFFCPYIGCSRSKKPDRGSKGRSFALSEGQVREHMATCHPPRWRDSEEPPLLPETPSRNLSSNANMSNSEVEINGKTVRTSTFGAVPKNAVELLEAQGESSLRHGTKRQLVRSDDATKSPGTPKRLFGATMQEAPLSKRPCRRFMYTVSEDNTASRVARTRLQAPHVCKTKSTINDMEKYCARRMPSKRAAPGKTMTLRSESCPYEPPKSVPSAEGNCRSPPGDWPAGLYEARTVQIPTIQKQFGMQRNDEVISRV